MRTYVLDLEAQANIQSQTDYLVAQGAYAAAEALVERLETYLADFLCHYPATGNHIKERDLWEIWIPRTRLVLWYRFTDSEMQIVRIWHSAQNRSAFDAN